MFIFFARGEPDMARRLSTLVLVGLLAVVCGGCVINIDLFATPYSVTAGDPITYKVKVTNPLQCPVAGFR
jgi:hypothetical protein